MLTHQDEHGAATGRQAVNYSFALLLVSLTPSLLGVAGRGYFLGAFLLGAGMVYYAAQMQIAPGTHPGAAALFRVDHLPAAAARAPGPGQIAAAGVVGGAREMKVDAATRRANLWLFLGLVVFAVALCALILFWMRSRTHAMGGTVYPPTTFLNDHGILEIAG